MAVGLFLTAIACPIVGTAILQASVVRGFRPGLWAALSVRYGTGGKTIVDGIPKGTYQNKLALRGQRVVAGAVSSDNDVFGLHGASRVFTRCGDPDP